MQFETSHLIALGALLVSLISFLTTAQNRKERASKMMLDEVENRWRKDLSDFKQEVVLGLSTTRARHAEAIAKITQLNLEFVQHQAAVVSRGDMDNIFEQRLEPVLRHMQKSEAFMEEILRSGLLLKSIGVYRRD